MNEDASSADLPKEVSLHLAVPSFFLHATTAYASLRRNGVVLGKRDYVGALQIRDDRRVGRAADRRRRTWSSAASAAPICPTAEGSGT